MNIQHILQNALGGLEKGAAENNDALQIAVGAASAQGYMDHLQKVANVTAEDVAQARNEEKGEPAVIENALTILRQNKMKPGTLVMGGKQNNMSETGSADGSSAKLAELWEIAAPYASIVEHIKQAAGYESDTDEKVACIAGCGDGCDYCGMSGTMKLSEAIDAQNDIEANAALRSGYDLATKFAAEVSEAADGQDSADHEALLADIAKAQSAADGKFKDMMFDNAQSDVPNFGGSTWDANPDHILRLLKPNLSHGLHGAR